MNPALASCVSKLRDFEDRGAGLALRDPGHAPLRLRSSVALPSLKAAALHPRRVEILDLIARDDTALEAADTWIILAPATSRVCAAALVIAPSDIASSRRTGLNRCMRQAHGKSIRSRNDGGGAGRS